MFTSSASAQRAALHPQELADLQWFESHPDCDEFLRPINWQIDPWVGKRGRHGHLYTHVSSVRGEIGFTSTYFYAPTERDDLPSGASLVDQIVLVDQRHREKCRVLEANSQQYKTIFWQKVGVR
jgi:hypothetical protein